MQGVLLSAYFYGYLVTQVIGGRLAELFSAKWTFFVSILVTAIFTLLTPLAANLGWGYLLGARVIEGMMGVSDGESGGWGGLRWGKRISSERSINFCW